MRSQLAVLAGAFLFAAWCIPAALAQPACVTKNMCVPSGAPTGAEGNFIIGPTHAPAPETSS